MFRDFKRGGYSLESTKVSGERLISLLLVISLAYLSATIEGEPLYKKESKAPDLVKNLAKGAIIEFNL
jgi:hypothetical protein